MDLKFKEAVEVSGASAACRGLFFSSWGGEGGGYVLESLNPKPYIINPKPVTF